MKMVSQNITLSLKILIVASFLTLALAVSGCWDDDCPEGCAPGYACYYGVCLSRGFCPLGTDDSDNCAQWETQSDGTLECVQRVDHGICDRGFACVCERLDPESDRCLERACKRATD